MLNRKLHTGPVFAAVAAFVASRALWLLALTPVFSDLPVYFRYAVNGIELGQIPYRDFVLEYPPVAYWCMALPRWLSSSRLPRDLLIDGRSNDFLPAYARTFRLEMLALDVMAFLLLLAIVRRRRNDVLAAAAWTYVLLTTILGHLLLDRLDSGVLFSLLLWAWSWLQLDGNGAGRSSAWPGFWQALGYAALGFGCSYKLIPAAIVPLVMIADVRALGTLKDGLRLAVGWLVLALAMLGPFAWYLHASGSKLWTLFAFHLDRGVEIESLWATPALALRFLGLDVRAAHGYGSWNIASPIDRQLLAASNAAMLLTLAVPLVRACWPTRSYSRTDAYRWSLAVLVVLILASKVLSSQYLIWGLPLAMLLGAELFSHGRFLLLCCGLVLTAALTTAGFPYLFFGSGDQHAHALVPSLDWLPTTLLIARNLLLLGLSAWLGWAMLGSAQCGSRLTVSRLLDIGLHDPLGRRLRQPANRRSALNDE